ncbi:FimV/HubP family polar landmark protein [Marinimicrobium alkaliphilum]|uniref:FimV/HubP family polar landmark protein n=1 Tax=Marinimicrobium alkaliphilum TaxID=2202654 RepID=UPI000DBA7D05|nr:FimV/HubP family polar landmark protein [Marinimicrobium alkaliphilum]
MHLLRKLITLSVFAFVAVAQQVSAMGLGEITLESALNQPLEAEIRLLNVRERHASDIVVRMAPGDDFRRAGIPVEAFHREVEFTVDLDAPGGPVVRLSSQRRVREPFLNFLVEARWPSGRLLREYTLLFDLPTFDDDQPAQPVEAARQAPTQPRQAPATQPRTEPRREQPQREATPARARGDVYGPIQANDTLWEIALRVRPDRSVSVQQTMLALQRANPEAFIDGNINLLRRGQVLRVPDADEIRSLNNQQAVSQVAAQNRAWSERTTGAQLDAGQRRAAPQREASEPSGQLRLATPGSAEGAQTGRADGADARSEQLAGELSATQEELDKSRRENTELTSRVRELEEQIDTMERLIQASNEQLRALQLAAEERASVEDAVVSEDVEAEQAAPADIADAEARAQERAEQAAEEEAEAARAQAEAEAAAAAAEAPARDPSRVVGAPARPSLFDRLQDFLLPLVGLLLALLVAAWYIVHRRKAGADDRDDEVVDEDLIGDDYRAEDDNDEDLFSFDEQAGDGESLDETYDGAGQETNQDDSDIDAETGDVVSEAEIYIAYGKLDQAEELLLKGLSREPGSAAILSKLLEVYAADENTEAFETYYSQLTATGDQARIADANALRAQLPGLVAAAGATDTPASSDGDDDLVFDLGDFDDDEPAFGLDEEPGFEAEKPLIDDPDALDGPEQAYDLSFDESETDAATEDAGEIESLDFDLSDDFDSGAVESEDASASTAVAPASASDDEFSFDLDSDLSLDDEALGGDAGKPESKDDSALSLEGDDEAADLEFESPGDVSDDDFTFDFDSTDTSGTPSDATAQADVDEDAFDVSLDDVDTSSTEKTAQAPAQEAGQEDEFDLDMDMGDVDLSALDDEMSELDADLELDAQPEAGPEQETPAEAESEQAPEQVSEEAEPVARPPEEDLSDDEMDAELDFLADTDEASTKLDLARAYIDMGDSDGARDILNEVIEEGSEEQRKEAEALIARVDS